MRLFAGLGDKPARSLLKNSNVLRGNSFATATWNEWSWYMEKFAATETYDGAALRSLTALHDSQELILQQSGLGTTGKSIKSNRVPYSTSFIDMHRIE